MKKGIESTTDLLHVDAPGILHLSRSVEGLTNAEVARRMCKSEETIARYQRPAAPGEHPYDMGISKVPLWNQAVGNKLVTKWIAQMSGGVFVFVDKDCPKDMNLTAQIGRLNDTTAAVVSHILRAMDDNKLDENERRESVRLLRETLSGVESALMIAEKGGKS